MNTDQMVRVIGALSLIPSLIITALLVMDPEVEAPKLSKDYTVLSYSKLMEAQHEQIRQRELQARQERRKAH
ncbi:MAG: hypothetical protein V3R67_08780 [Thermodesulfobacteriota bacterium]